jgi:hypothetical protein
MKLSELTVGKEYAIVPSWTYSSKNARDINTVRENDVVKATLLELTKYEYEPSQRRDNTTGFRKAQAGNRSVGVLVKGVDNNGGDIYWTSRLADIVAEWSVLEPKWSAKKIEQEEQERIQNEKQNRVRELRRRVDEEINRSRNSILASAKELLGANTFVDVDSKGYDEDYRAVVSLSLAEFERLIELSYEGKAVIG